MARYREPMDDTRDIPDAGGCGRPRRFVSREAFARSSLGVPVVDPDRLRQDIDAVIDPYPDDPFAR